jgi:hypothetical protein
MTTPPKGALTPPAYVAAGAAGEAEATAPAKTDRRKEKGRKAVVGQEEKLGEGAVTSARSLSVTAAVLAQRHKIAAKCPSCRWLHRRAAVYGEAGRGGARSSGRRLRRSLCAAA